MKITVNLDCKTGYVSKSGEIPLTFRVTINRKNDYLPMGRKIKAEHYDKVKKRIKPGVKGYPKIAAFIKRQEAKVDKVINDLEKQGEVITFRKIKEGYNTETVKVKAVDFFDYVDGELKRELRETDIEKQTIDYWKTQYNRLKDYRPKISIYEIDKQFLINLSVYLKGKFEKKSNRLHVMSFIRKYTKRLFNEGHIKVYPFKDFVLGQPEVHEADYLEPEEITVLHDLYDSKKLLSIYKPVRNRKQPFHLGARLQSTLQQVLVSCYSGLRHSDIASLRKEHIQSGYIVKEMVKGRLGKKTTVRVPIRKRLYSLLDLDNPNGHLFSQTVLSNQYTNKYLKELFEKAGIDKPVSFHDFRHTFAINSLLLGVKIEVVSDILGHSTLTTTQRYAKVVDRLRDQEMDKWDKIAQEELPQDTQTINCPKCKSPLLTYQKSVFRQGNLSLQCNNCGHEFDHQLTSHPAKMEISA